MPEILLALWSAAVALGLALTVVWYCKSYLGRGKCSNPPKGPVSDLGSAELLESWADMMAAHLKLSGEDFDANGVSDQRDTHAKIAALRTGASAIRGAIVGGSTTR